MKLNIFLTLIAGSAAAIQGKLGQRAAAAFDLECDKDHAPNVDDCRALIDAIKSGTAKADLNSGKQTIRQSSCFVSWSKHVVGNQNDLVSHITLLTNSCVAPTQRSGIIKNVDLNGQKFAVCLSNRGTGCAN